MTFFKKLILLLIPFIAFNCKTKEQPITKDEALSFAKNLESSVGIRSGKAFDNFFEEDVFIDRISDLTGSESKKDIISGARAAIQNADLGKEIIISMGKDGTYEFVKHYEKDSRHHIIFRLFGEGGLNYHDIELVKTKNTIRAADIYVLITGENFSKTIADLLVSMEGLYSKSGKNSISKHSADMKKFKQLIQQRSFSEAKKIFHQLPSELRDSKPFRLMYLSVLSETDMKAYQEELNSFEKDFSNDASAQLSLIDGFIVKGEFEKAQRAINIVDSTIKGDPFLHYYRALLYNQMDDIEKNIEHLEILHREMPHFGDGVLELVASYAETNQIEKARKLMDEYRNNKSFDQSKADDFVLYYSSVLGE